MWKEAVELSERWLAGESIDENSMLNFYKKWIYMLAKKDIYVPSSILYGNKYSLKSGICLFFEEDGFVVNFCKGERREYGITHNGDDTIENNILADEIISKNIERIKNILTTKIRVIGYPYRNVDMISKIEYSSRLQDNCEYESSFYTNIEEGYSRMCNRSWVNKHRLSKYVDNPNFKVRLLEEKDKEQLIAMHKVWENQKVGDGNYGYFSFYSRSSKKWETLYDRVEGLFYEDILLAYRMSETYTGDSGDVLYAYVENSVTGINDEEYLNPIIKLLSHRVGVYELKRKIESSNEIGKEILVAKTENKFKKAKSLTSNKLFLGTLEEPMILKERALQLFEEQKEDITNSIKSLVNIRMKHLFLNKLIDSYKKNNIRSFSVDAGVSESLTAYKKSVNTNNGGMFLSNINY